MSNAGNRPKGPIEIQMESLWQAVWKAQRAGEVHEALVAHAESEFAKFSASPKLTDETAFDFRMAEIYHLFQSRAFYAHMEDQKIAIATYRPMFQWALTELSNLSQQTSRSLTLAHGAVVLAVLALIGNDKDVLRTSAPAWIIGLCSIGFLLTILGSHAGVLIATRSIKPVAEIIGLRLSDEGRAERIKSIDRTAFLSKAFVRPIFYVSFALLAVALFVGIRMFLDEQKISAPSPRSTSYISHNALR